MGTSTTQPMTVEEFRKLPETGPFYYELRNGELAQVTRPKFKYFRIQLRIRKLLGAHTPPDDLVMIELAYRPLPEHELRVADVAYVNPERWESIDPEDNLRGAPDLLVEVISPRIRFPRSTRRNNSLSRAAVWNFGW